MSDIFISYGSQDSEWVCALDESLEKYGLSVWWDPEIKLGEVYQKVIQSALDNAHCVIVVWAQKSAELLRVQSEASQAIERDVLIPLRRTYSYAI